MKIVHVASELFPYVKTGGLADAVGALTATLAERGHEVSVFLPGYRRVLDHPEAASAERRLRLKIEMADQFLSGEIRVFSPRPNLTIYLVCRDEFFDRRHPYGNGERDYEDNADRYIFFCKGVVETLRLGEMQADIVHGHDWQAALVPLLLREAERRHGVTLAIKTVLTIHNIAYQGVFPAAVFGRRTFPRSSTGWTAWSTTARSTSSRAGILFADRVTTVSPRYAKEIQTPEFGCGLEGVVQTRAEDLVGLLNGVDTTVWNPAVDPSCRQGIPAADLAGKAACRAELLKKSGFAPGLAGPSSGWSAGWSSRRESTCSSRTGTSSSRRMSGSSSWAPANAGSRTRSGPWRRGAERPSRSAPGSTSR